MWSSTAFRSRMTMAKILRWTSKCLTDSTLRANSGLMPMAWRWYRGRFRTIPIKSRNTCQFFQQADLPTRMLVKIIIQWTLQLLCETCERTQACKLQWWMTDRKEGRLTFRVEPLLSWCSKGESSWMINTGPAPESMKQTPTVKGLGLQLAISCRYLIGSWAGHSKENSKSISNSPYHTCFHLTSPENRGLFN